MLGKTKVLIVTVSWRKRQAYRLLGFFPLVVLYVLIVLLEQQFSLGVAASIYVGVVIFMTLSGAMLLRSTAVGQVSWKNRLATQLLPCLGTGEYESLNKLCVFNLLGTILFGLVCFIVTRYLRQHDYAPDRLGGWTIACTSAWIVLIGMVVFLVGQYARKYYAGSSGLLRFLTLLAAPAGALAASIALVAKGLPFVAFVVAMIPIAIVFVPMAFLLIIVIVMKLFGKPFRWN